MVKNLEKVSRWNTAKIIFTSFDRRFAFFFPLVASLICLLIIIHKIIYPSFVGIADQGDFYRMMDWSGIAYANPESSSNYFNWINRYYLLTEGKAGIVLSSEILIVLFTRAIHSFLNLNQFDIKILGLVHAILVSTALYTIFFFLKKLNKFYFFIAVPMIFYMLLDVGYLAYFNSMYQEPSGLIFLLFAIGAILKILSEKKKKTSYGSVLFIVYSLLLIATKAQYFVLSIPVIIAFILLFKDLISKKVILFISTVIFLFSLGFYFVSTPPIIKKWNVYNTSFAQVLGNASDKERAANILKIDQRYLSYAGRAAYTDDSGIGDVGVSKYLNTITMLRVLKYYFLTPKEFFSTMFEVARQSTRITVYYLGYYPENSGFLPLTQPSSPNSWGQVRQNILKPIAAIISLLLVFVPAFFYFRYKKYQEKFSLLGLFLSLSAASQFFMVVVSEALIGGPEKHLFLFSILLDFLFIFFFLFCLKRILSCCKFIIHF